MSKVKNLSQSSLSKLKPIALSLEQTQALELLKSGENIFLTGEAGSGKSTIIRELLRNQDPKLFPTLASTGAAAVLIGGRTFHSFFGLGLMEGGPRQTFDKVTKDPRTLKRLASVEGFIIDEISMLSAEAFTVAEELCRFARDSHMPWGGLRVLAVGDFAQLPPVTMAHQQREFVFETPSWERSQFISCSLKQNHRVEDPEYLKLLNKIRVGVVDEFVEDLLNSRVRHDDEDDKGLRLFPHRKTSEDFNRRELECLDADLVEVPSILFGPALRVQALLRNSPIPEVLHLKEGAHVMFVQNDPQKKWVNGTRGKIIKISKEELIVEKANGREVTVAKADFSMMDAEGKVVASLHNFPVTLAYATTIHKSQGATLEKVWLDLTRLWEPGHGYVALSRLKSSSGLNLLGWRHSSFKVDPKVISFHKNLQLHQFDMNLDANSLAEEESFYE